jgi:hypothetical protein
MGTKTFEIVQFLLVPNFQKNANFAGEGVVKETLQLPVTPLGTEAIHGAHSNHKHKVLSC